VNKYAQLTKTELSAVFLKNVKTHPNVTECTLSLAKFIQKSTDLIHLDLSYNGFTSEEADEIAKALIQN
jgi:Ran GTPase-activating protein (RanGAP) involved in mRNA processing and transport